ncbi:copper-binding protein [Myxococcota bacterium]|nr:copper-binding protein [Myxococcota bacterium]MCZ7619605.1 copper-binding protein [Myxococcota bacterium]
MQPSARLVRSLRLALAAALLLALPACAEQAGQNGIGQGRIVAIDVENAEITLDHGDIPGLMEAMTMPFPVSDPKLLEGLQVGQQVEFDLEHRGGMYTVKGIRPAAP